MTELGAVTIFEHIPVLMEQTLDGLAVCADGTYIDGTIGGGGHAQAMLERGAGCVLGIDRDPEALAAAAERLRPYGNRVTLVQGNFRDIGALARAHGFAMVDGILLDLGVSSYQLDAAARGFSLKEDAPLDMRMDPGQELTAADLVNTLPEAELADIIYRYGEERASRRIARRIVERRRHASITRTTELAALVAQAVGGKGGRIHPATRTFQALRIVVNDELGALQEALPAANELLTLGGRLAVISFHSLEDRIVKAFMRREAAHDRDVAPRLTLITKKPIVATQVEMRTNRRSRSAKLRVAQRMAYDEQRISGEAVLRR